MEREVLLTLKETASVFGGLAKRAVVAMESIATALTDVAKIKQSEFDIAHPPERPKRAGEITRPSDEKQQQFSDKPEAGWVAETEREVSRFQTRFEQDSKKKR